MDVQEHDSVLTPYQSQPEAYPVAVNTFNSAKIECLPSSFDLTATQMLLG